MKTTASGELESRDSSRLRRSAWRLAGLIAAFAAAVALGGSGVFKGRAGLVPWAAAAALGLGAVVAASVVAFRLGRRRTDNARAGRGSAGLALGAVAVGGVLAAMSLHAVWAVVAGPMLALVAIVSAAFTAGRTGARGWMVLAILAGPASAAWLGYMFAGPGYYAEFNHIKAELAKIPGVRIVEAGGNRDLTFEDIWARIDVAGKGEVTLMGLTRAAFGDTPDLHVAKIGPYSFRRESWGYGAVIDREGKPVWSQSFGFTWNVGRDGEFGPQGVCAGKLPAQIRNVRDVVDHYDQLCAALQDVKDEKLFVRNPDGSTVEYFVRTKAGRGRG